jgi:hypothetical protein
MNPFRIALPLLVLAALPACIPVPVPNGTPGSIVVDPGDSCGARRLQGFVGQNVSVVRGTTIQAPGPVRILVPGDLATADVDPTRINVRTDAAGTVVVVDCG